MIDARSFPLIFANVAEKAAWMQKGAIRDTRSETVRRWAARFAPVHDPFLRASAILRFAQVCITYTRDPGEEVLESSAIGLERGFGDCDVKARLFVALCLLTDLEAELEPIIRGETFPHVRARVKIAGRWLTVDPSILNSEVGALPRVPITNFERR